MTLPLVSMERIYTEVKIAAWKGCKTRNKIKKADQFPGCAMGEHKEEE
jgi:hypothetical protein